MTAANVEPAGRGVQTFDAYRVRADFPALSQQVHGHPLVYLDSAATAQKPAAVIRATERVYAQDCANVHRGVHLLSERATAAFEGTREKLARFIGAEARDIVFTRGATEAINLVAQSFGKKNMRAGDEVLLSVLEHHSNIVPWQLLADEIGIKLSVIPIDSRGELSLDAFEEKCTTKTRLIAVTWVSNALGTMTPIGEIVRRARGIPVLVDAAQAFAHVPVDVRALGIDFLVASAHKAYGPTGVGVLWGRREHLSAMPPVQGGGDMIETVSFKKTTFREPPARFEAGTPNIAGVIGWGAAIDYLSALDRAAIQAHERDLLAYTNLRLAEIKGVRLVASPREQVGVVSFVFDDIHPHDVGTILDREGIAVRAGHHCAQPLMEHLGLVATVRASLALYNTRNDIDALVHGLKRVREVFG